MNNVANMKRQEADVATVQSTPLPLWEPHPRTGRAASSQFPGHCRTGMAPVVPGMPTTSAHLPQEPTIRRKQQLPLGVVTWSV